jgi:hypothetical protein
MLIPKALYGPHASVLQRVRKAIPRLKTGASLDDALEARDALETSTTPGDIWIERPRPGSGRGDEFHPEVLADALDDAFWKGKLEWDTNEARFKELLGTPWGALSILGRSNAQLWLRGDERFQTYLDGLLQHRALLEGVGARFHDGAGTPRPWYAFPHGPVFAMANLGVARQDLEKFMESGVLPRLEPVAAD